MADLLLQSLETRQLEAKAWNCGWDCNSLLASWLDVARVGRWRWTGLLLLVELLLAAVVIVLVEPTTTAESTSAATSAVSWYTSTDRYLKSAGMCNHTS